MSDFTFKPDTHQYYLDGRELPSVTTVLKRAGLSEDWYYSDEVANFGDYGHQALCLMLRNDLETYDPRFEPWMIGIRKFLAEQQPAPFFHDRLGIRFTMTDATERMVHSAFHAGTLDFVGHLASIRFPVIVDWKFWSQASKTVLDLAGLQTAGYEIAFKFMDPRVKPLSMKRYVAHFFRGDYRLHPLTDPADHAVFQSAVNCVSWKAAH